jgi:hypothetical protein
LYSPLSIAFALLLHTHTHTHTHTNKRILLVLGRVLSHSLALSLSHSALLFHFAWRIIWWRAQCGLQRNLLRPTPTRTRGLVAGHYRCNLTSNPFDPSSSCLMEAHTHNEFYQLTDPNNSLCARYNQLNCTVY